MDKWKRRMKNVFQEYEEHSHFKITEYNKESEKQYRKELRVKIENKVIVIYFILVGILLILQKELMDNIICRIMTTILFVPCLVYALVKIWSFFCKSFFLSYLFFMFIICMFEYGILELYVKPSGKFESLMIAILLMIVSNLIFIFIEQPYILNEISRKQARFTNIVAFISAIMIIIVAEYGRSFVLQTEEFPSEEDIYKEMQEEYLTADVREILSKNEEFEKDIIHIILEYEIEKCLNEITSEVSLVGAYITIFNVIGSLCITFKVEQNSKKAEKHWRECILNNNVSYKDMVQCVYYGGKDFEHIFLSNDKYKEIILDNEKK